MSDHPHHAGGHGGHDHHAVDRGPGHEGHGHEHDHQGGIRGFFAGVFSPHSHDASDQIDSALTASAEGMRALKISLAGLGATAAFQVVIVVVSGSVALLADTVHNFSDALTAVPLGFAFLVGRRRPTERYTYGYGRAEDLAGVFIVAMIAISAVVAGGETVWRLLDPPDVRNVGWVMAAGLVGFAGNELVAVYRIRVGRRIGSAALVADGLHARTRRPDLARRRRRRPRRGPRLSTGGPHRRIAHHLGHPLRPQGRGPGPRWCPRWSSRRPRTPTKR